MISNVAGQIVASFLKENSEALTMQELAATLLEDLSFPYEDFDSSCPEKAFRSIHVLNLLGSTHLQQTYGWVDIPSLDLRSKWVHGVKGALALCTAAVNPVCLLVYQTNMPFAVGTRIPIRCGGSTRKHCDFNRR